MIEQAAKPDWLQQLDGLQALISNKLTLRNLRPGEPLPDSLPHKQQPGTVMPQPDWIWLVELRGQPIAMLIAGPVQNIACLLVLAVASTPQPGDKVASLMLLLRGSLAQMRERGYAGFMVCLDPKLPAEAKLLQIVRKLISLDGQKQFSGIGEGMVLAWGLTDVSKL